MLKEIENLRVVGRKAESCFVHVSPMGFWLSQSCHRAGAKKRRPYHYLISARTLAENMLF